MRNSGILCSCVGALAGMALGAGTASAQSGGIGADSGDTAQPSADPTYYD